MRVLSGTHLIIAPQRGFHGWRMAAFADIALTLSPVSGLGGLTAGFAPRLRD